VYTSDNDLRSDRQNTVATLHIDSMVANCKMTPVNRHIETAYTSGRYGSNLGVSFFQAEGHTDAR